MAKKKDKVDEAVVVPAISNLQKAQEIRNQLNKKFDKKLAMVGSENPYLNVERIGTGALGLDLILGGSPETGYGFPLGRCVELFGPEHAGKTALALSTVARAQAKGYLCAIVDNESTFDEVFARSLGVNVDELIVTYADNATEALGAVESLADSGAVKVIILDSIGSLIAETETENEIDKQSMGGVAKLLTKFVNRVVPSLRNNGCLLISLNQLRDVISSYGGGTYTPGGRSFKHQQSIRLELKRLPELYKNDKKEDIGVQVLAHTKKNKTGKPFQTAGFVIGFEDGILKEVALYEAAKSKGIIVTSGAWTYFGDQKWNGKDKLVQEMKLEPKLFAEIEKLTLAAINNPGTVGAFEEQEND